MLLDVYSHKMAGGQEKYPPGLKLPPRPQQLHRTKIFLKKFPKKYKKGEAQ
ncbi:hypothetical protein P378_02530 [Desulforamulus profundi]|uniref:Uncharacterized protein n=1 Tax=Desulforamulus profundi TaxID=1383067 RepID=A0A2C6MJH0_9FIRM|nr:hypothetical protein P378_02530 [Desulforamulus profundi]